MAEFEWSLQPTRHFGSVWTPVARLYLADVAGRWRGLMLQIDSGAVISLLRRSIADVLGLRLDSGRRVDVSGVGQSVTIAYVHRLALRIGEGIEIKADFAIADHERVPNLLGRAGIFDRLRIAFDPTKHMTQMNPT